MIDGSTIVEWAAALVTISAACGIIVRAVTKDVANGLMSLGERHNDLKHSVKNQISRIDAIEHLRVDDMARLVKLETNYANLERGQARIEHQLEKMEADNASGRAEIIESLRELRNVSPRA